MSYNSVFHVKALVFAFYQKEALVGAFSVILKTDGSFAALICAALTVSGAPMSLHLGLAAARGLGRGGAQQQRGGHQRDKERGHGG